MEVIITSVIFSPTIIMISMFLYIYFFDNKKSTSKTDNYISDIEEHKIHPNPLIIGICGGSGSGKTYVSEKIIKYIKKIYGSTDCSNVCYMSQDSYYYGGNPNTNYDIIEAIDFPLFIKHIDNLIKGKEIDAPIYDFVSHSRKNETIRILPCKIIIIEGILIYTQKELRDMCNLKFFIEADDTTRMARRIIRDQKERGRDLESIIEMYQKNVKDSYDTLVKPSSKYADFSINNNIDGKYPRVDLITTFIDKQLESICN